MGVTSRGFTNLVSSSYSMLKVVRLWLEEEISDLLVEKETTVC